MALSTRMWYRVLKGPGVGRLITAGYGEGDRDVPHSPFLTFTVSGPQGLSGEQHKIKIFFESIKFDRFVPGEYKITGVVEEVNGKKQKKTSTRHVIGVVVGLYRPSLPRRDTYLQINHSQMFDLDEYFTEDSD